MEEPSPLASRATLEALEFPVFLSLVSQLAATDLGRRRILDLMPHGEVEALEGHRRCVEEASRALDQGPLVPSIEEPLSPLLYALTRGGPSGLEGGDYVLLGELLSAGEQALALFRDGSESYPELAGRCAPIPSVSSLVARIERTFDSRGELREDATPRLKLLRQRARRQRQTLYEELNTYVQVHRGQLTDETLSLREGRLSVLLPAGSRGRLPGLYRGRSATGKSYYFEPIELVDSNNELQQATEEEDAERRRILRELLEEVLRNLPVVEQHARLVAFLDLLQASCRLAELWDARLVELAPAQELRLAAARHPLLDPRLAELRQTALQQTRSQVPIVPLDLELTTEKRALVVTGPNAGGKTVALKTLGLLVLAHQSGLPIGAAAGTRLPCLARLIALVGDEQDLLADRSTFSARLLGLKEAWHSAGPDSLILLDELGSGTNPEEGAALAISLLEGICERRALALVTTHLTPLAAAALELPGAGCAAMEFDAGTLNPTFRLLLGPPGGSEAISLARRLGLPEDWLRRAEERLGHEHRDLRRLLAEVEQVRAELAAREEEMRRARLAVEERSAELAREQERLRTERDGLAQRFRSEFESFRRKTRERFHTELEKLAQEHRRGRRRGLAEDGTERLFADAPIPQVEEDLSGAGDVAVGMTVRHVHQGWRGRLDKLQRGRAEVLVQGKRVRCHKGDLVATEAPTSPPAGKPRAQVTTTGNDGLDLEINLVGQRVEPALEALDHYLDRAIVVGYPEVRVVHGHGTGRLRDAVREYLRTHRGVAGQEPAPRNRGGDGATVVTLHSG